MSTPEIQASDSDSDAAENEQISILKATKNAPSPPRKKRRLNNNHSKAQPYEDPSPSSSPSSDSNHETKSESLDNETSSYQINIKNKKRRKHPSQSQQQHHRPIYKFGDKKYTFPLTINPGAVVRLRLQNFLCHSNFEIVFHPFVNIIHGQNGAGKSAIEAGISMALGQNSRKTGRGKKITDVIQDGKDWAVITLHLHNQGPERLEEYGKEIIIERRLTRTGANGASYFKVMDVTLKKKGSGVKLVKSIAEKFNLAVDNPCVILKQSVAKQFLNTTKDTDKFKFFMQASKLGSYLASLKDAKLNVDTAREQQKMTKGSFVAIRTQYYEAKRKKDTVERIDTQKEKVKYWKRAEKYMIYDCEKKKINGYKKEIESCEFKIEQSKNKLEQIKSETVNNIECGKVLKQEIEEKGSQLGRFAEPITQLKKTQNDLDKKRTENVRKMNSKHKYIDRSKKKIVMYTRQKNELLKSIQNNERGRKLAAISVKLTEYGEKLETCRKNRDPLSDKSEKTIEMKNNEQQLLQKQNEIYNINNEINKLQQQLAQLNQQRNRSEYFLFPSLRSHRNNNNSRNQISVYRIGQIIQRHQRKFSRLPIGPLGEFVNMIPQNDQEKDNRNIQIVQSVLQNSLYVFLVNNSADQQIFNNIMRQEFGKSVPSIQYKYSNQMEQINHNPFQNYNNRNGPLIRVSDMFTIRDNNPWIYNAILTNSQPERVYAHGDLQRAKSFLNELDSHVRRQVNCVMTYGEQNGLYRVEKRGNTVSGTPQRRMDPILQSDTSQLKQWYEHELNIKQQEKQGLNAGIFELERFVNENNIQIREFERELIQCNRNIKMFENKIEKLQRQQIDLQEEEEGNDQLQIDLQELQNSITDEKQEIEQFENEEKPFKLLEIEINQKLLKIKQDLNQIELQLKNEKYIVDSQQRKLTNLLNIINKQKKTIAKIPIMIEKYSQNLLNINAKYSNEKNRINELLNEAQKYGSDFSNEEWPRNELNRNRFYTFIELKRARVTLESEIEASENQLGNGNGEENREEIRKRYEMIRPKYENHQKKVENCNFNVDEMAKLLSHRTKEYKLMKTSVADKLSVEFRYIMQQQGHDGKLILNYQNQTLELKCNMSSHDSSSSHGMIRNTKTLSGGERSFSQIAFIMALQKFSGSPFCIYDEFDVFMDSVNRGNSIKILLTAALGKDEKNNNNNNKNNNENKKRIVDRQYLFITPNDVSPIITQGHKNKIRIHQLKPPRRNK